METLLGDQKFFGGDHVTIADISLGVSLPSLEKVEPSLGPNEKLDAWYQRLIKEVPVLHEYNQEASKIFKEMMEKK